MPLVVCMRSVVHVGSFYCFGPRRGWEYLGSLGGRIVRRFQVIEGGRELALPYGRGVWCRSIYAVPLRRWGRVFGRRASGRRA